MKKILIIEDEEPLADALKYSLGKEGYDAAYALDGNQGLTLFEQGDFDLVVLDLMLPGIDGLEVCKRIRRTSSVPILMLTAKDSDIDEVLGLELGADDYVVKPFNSRKLIARIKALMRRSSGEHAEVGNTREYAGIFMDLDRHEVRAGGQVIDLTPTEYQLLELMLSRPGKVLTREFLSDQVWDGFYGSSKTLDVHIRHLREKLEPDPSRPRLIRTVRGAGYRLEGAAEQG
jgi:two-component system response regulator RegX3